MKNDIPKNDTKCIKEEGNIADNLSSDLFFLRKRLRDAAVHIKPSISEDELVIFVEENMRMIDERLMKLIKR